MYRICQRSWWTSFTLLPSFHMLRSSALVVLSFLHVMPVAWPLASRVQITRILLVNPKRRKLCLAHAFIEGPKISRSQCSNSSRVTWKENDQQYPPVKSTGWLPPPRSQPGCRTTHSKNLGPLGSSPARFLTLRILLARRYSNAAVIERLSVQVCNRDDNTYMVDCYMCINTLQHLQAYS